MPYEEASHDFDFLVGSWTVVNRRLRQHWKGSDAWEVFSATARSYPILEGRGNIDEMSAPNRGIVGMTLRIFSQDQRVWSLYWIDGAGKMFPPVVGCFQDGVGIFYGDDLDGDRKVRVRFHWTNITSESARWEQAFSDDGEVSWETNWIMTFSRAREVALLIEDR